MSQALVASYVNDWLGWFYPGYSGFHPQKRIKKIREKEIKDTKRIRKF